MEFGHQFFYCTQEDLISFIDFRMMKVKQEEQFKYEVWYITVMKVP